ncbi:MAG: multidrug effflux MFS transporter [Coxiellaceae bacterium]|nr:multidrug effflux MFS transporter [Coxiellaceae bacterium]
MYKTAVFFILMFLLSCMGQISSDVYLPALPVISEDLGVPVHPVQLTIALFFFGFAVSHLFYGPISDSVGRRKPLIVGIIIAMIGSVICIYTTHIRTLEIGRFVQGFGAGAAATIYRSVLSDLYYGKKLSKVSSFLDISRIFLLASSPLIGAIIMHITGSWRSCFQFLFLYSAVSLIGVLLILKETNEHKHLHKVEIKHIANNIFTLVSSKVFMGYTLFVMLTFGGILCWLTTLPIVLQRVVGMSQIGFGGVSALAGMFFMVGGVINAFLVGRLGLNRMLFIGFSIMLLAGLLMLGLGLYGYIDIYVIMVPVITFIIGSSMVFPNSYAGAFRPFKMMAGTASAIFGFMQILGGAVSSFIMSYMQTYNQIPLSIALIVVPGCAFVILATMVNQRSMDAAIAKAAKTAE